MSLSLNKKETSLVMTVSKNVHDIRYVVFHDYIGYFMFNV